MSANELASMFFSFTSWWAIADNLLEDHLIAFSTTNNAHLQTIRYRAPRNMVKHSRKNPRARPNRRRSSIRMTRAERKVSIQIGNRRIVTFTPTSTKWKQWARAHRGQPRAGKENVPPPAKGGSGATKSANAGKDAPKSGIAGIGSVLSSTFAQLRAILL